jgi:hypothetical protein
MQLYNQFKNYYDELVPDTIFSKSITIMVSALPPAKMRSCGSDILSPRFATIQ